MNNMQCISVFGLGHMGLPTAALFANSGLEVIGVDINPETVKTINKGRSPIIEPGLENLVKKTVSQGLLKATLDGFHAGKNSQTKMVIVGTPLNQEKKADLSAVLSACKTISKSLNKGDLVIIESTIPPGTCAEVIIPILEDSGLKAGKEFYLAFTPERALPNNTIYEITHNARVIGGINQESLKRATLLYQRITCGEIINVKNIITAEMIKLMENTYRDTNIALANELALVCESLGVDVMEAIKAANHHPRVNIHTPGPGVGGHCLSIDPYFIVEKAEEKKVETDLIQTSRRINENMPRHVVRLVSEALKEKKIKIKDASIGILGVAYKADVADARETPAEEIIRILLSQGAEVYTHDPLVNLETMRRMGGFPSSFHRVLECDCVVLVTDHQEYKRITPQMIKNSALVCTRPLLNPEDFKIKNFIFKGVGRV